MRVSNAVGST
jgi:tetratricopeptide (TPR) repeat protein